MHLHAELTMLGICILSLSLTLSLSLSLCPLRREIFGDDVGQWRLRDGSIYSLKRKR